jgi:hypothetical protein
MKLGQKLAAALCLSLGVFLLVTSLDASYRHESEVKQDINSAIASIVIGLSASALGGWIVWNLHQKQAQENQDLLGRVFYELLKKNNGYITVSQLARETHVNTKVAEKYLEQQTKKFNGIFELVTTGEAIYVFSSNLYTQENCDR